MPVGITGQLMGCTTSSHLHHSTTTDAAAAGGQLQTPSRYVVYDQHTGRLADQHHGKYIVRLINDYIAVSTRPPEGANYCLGPAGLYSLGPCGPLSGGGKELY